MVDLAGQFGVALTAQIGVDRGSLRRVQKDIGDAVGKPVAGVKLTPDKRAFDNAAGKLQAPVRVTPDLRSWQRSVGQLDKAIPKGAIGNVSQKLWGAAGGQVRTIDEIKKASTPAAKETGFVARHLGAIKNRLKETWHLDGFGRAVEQFREGRNVLGEFRDKAEGVGKIFGPAEGLIGIGSAAGIGAMVESYGSRAGGLERSAGRIGVSTDMLQRWGGAAELAGLSSDQATGSIDNLQKSLRFARLGVPQGAQALGTAKQLGLDVREDPAEFLKHLADRMKGQAPKVQEAMAEAFGVGDLLPLLQRGRQAIEDYTLAAERNRHLTPEQIEAGRQLEMSYNGAIQATLGLKDAIGAQLTPTFKPMLDGWVQWTNQLKNNPGELQAVTTGVEVLAAALGVTAVGAVGKLVIAMNSWWALPATRFLVAGGGGLLAGIAGIVGLYEGADAFKKKFPGLPDQRGRGLSVPQHQASPANAPSVVEPERWQDAGHHWHVGPRPGAIQAPAAPAAGVPGAVQAPAAQTVAPAAGVPGAVQAPAGVTGPQGAIQAPSELIPAGWQPAAYPNAPVESAQDISHPERNNPGNLRVSQTPLNALGRVTKPGEAFDAWDTAEHGIQARARTYASYLRRGVDTITQIAETSGPASDNNNVAAEIAAYRQALGGKYAAEGGEKERIELTPENLRRLTAGGISIEAGGQGKWLPKGYGMPAIDVALTHMAEQGAPAFAGPGVAAPQGIAAPGAEAASADEMLSMKGLDRNVNRGQINGYLRTAGEKLDVGVEAWCAAFVNTALYRQGIKGSGSDVATDFAKWGVDVAVDQVRKGDVLVKMRGHRPGETGGHVGEATGQVNAQGQIEMVQGNIGGRVDTSWENPGELIARRALENASAASDDRASPGVSPAANGGDYEPADSDSMHHLTVEFVNAPQGMRSGLRGSRGPSDVTTRTQTAFEAP